MPDNEAYLQVEELLVSEGFISKEEMAMARRIRDADLARSRETLAALLAKQGGVPREELSRLLGRPETQADIGALALEEGRITPEQLTACRKEAADKGQPLGPLLVKKGHLPDADWKKLAVGQLDSLAFAKEIVKQGLVRERDLEEALRTKNYRKSTCEILAERNLISLSELNHVFRRCNEDLKLGQILVQQGLISEETLNEALSLQASNGSSLGKILVSKRWIAVEQLYFALSIQFNTPFQKLEGYTFYRKQKAQLRDIVGNLFASENRVVPLFQNGNNLTLGMSNPADIQGMHKLKTMYPELQISCVLITDEKFEQLYALLYGEILRRLNEAPPGAAAPEDEGVEVIVCGPERENERIETLYRTYRGLRRARLPAGGAAPSEEAQWFRDFIVENYRTICRRYGCTRVLFRCDSQDGRPLVLAAPIP